jgi:hypothetical protein
MSGMLGQSTLGRSTLSRFTLTLGWSTLTHGRSDTRSVHTRSRYRDGVTGHVAGARAEGHPGLCRHLGRTTYLLMSTPGRAVHWWSAL